MSSLHRSIHETAADLHALINSRPTSPRIDELEATLSKMAAPDLAALREWDAQLAAHLASYTSERRHTDEDVARIEEGFLDACKAIWAKPVRNIGDLMVRLAMAVHWNSPFGVTDPAYPDWAFKEEPDGLFDNKALAYLVRGLLDLTGLHFDPNGRLLTTEAHHG